MSAVIHTLPRHRRGGDPPVTASGRSQVSMPTPREADTDDLLAELARAVESDEPRFVGTADGPRLLVSIRPDRRGGANDLVAVTAPGDAAGRRMVVLFAALALALVLAMVAGLGGAMAEGDIEVAGTTTLQSGQTLWQLADEMTPAGQDVRPNLEALMTVNQFDSAALPAGTLVLLPVVD